MTIIAIFVLIIQYNFPASRKFEQLRLIFKNIDRLYALPGNFFLDLKYDLL